MTTIDEYQTKYESLLEFLDSILTETPSHSSDQRIMNYIYAIEPPTVDDLHENKCRRQNNILILDSIVALVDEHKQITNNTLDDILETLREIDEPNIRNILETIIRQKAKKIEQGDEYISSPTPPELTRLGGYFNERLGGVFKCQNTKRLGGYFNDKKNKIPPQLEGKLYNIENRENEVFNKGGIPVAIGNRHNPPYSSDEEVPCGASPTVEHRESQHETLIGNGGAISKRRSRTLKGVVRNHIKMSRDYRRLQLRSIELQLKYNMDANGKRLPSTALWSGKIGYIRIQPKLMPDQPVRWKFADFITQTKFRENLKKPISKPSYANRNKTGLPTFKDDPWWIELNEWLKYQNQERKISGLPEILISHSQHKEMKKNRCVWVHKDDYIALMLYRDMNGNPVKVILLNKNYAIDFDVLNKEYSDNAKSFDYRSVWFKK